MCCLCSWFSEQVRSAEIIIIKSDTSSSSGSSSFDEYDSSSSSGSLSSPNEYEIVSSKGSYKYLLKWYDDTTDEDIPEFKFLKRKAKGNASSSSACCDDTSNQEFPDDDDSSNEDFPDDDDRNDEDFQVEVKKAKTCKDSSDDDIPKSSKSQAKTSKGKASYSIAYKTRASTSSKSKGVPQAITLKNPVAQPIIVKSLIAIKNCVIGLENRKTRDRIQKKQFGVRKPTVADGSDCSFGECGKEICYSLTKLKAARYDLEGIEEMIPHLWSLTKVAYEKDVALGIIHSEPKRKLFYKARQADQSIHKVHSQMKILSIVRISVDKHFGYGYLKENVVRRTTQKEYTFKEADFPRLHLNYIKDML
ncbi:hypothetical protein Tco_1332366 [Tanacetum coccineum]